MLINQLIDSITENAYHHWRDYIIDGHIYIDKSDVLDRAFTRLCGYDMPDELHAECLQDSDFIQGIEYMRSVIRDQAEDHLQISKMYSGTVHERLRAVGMSMRDFV